MTSQYSRTRHITEKVNHFKDSGLTFSIGDEINPSWQDVCTVLRHLYTAGYTAKYRLVQTHIPHEILFTQGSKEQYHSLIPQVVRNAELLVQTNNIDVFDAHNYRLVVAIYVLSWYWYKQLGGPKPATRGLKSVEVRKIIQNEPLCCPICYKKFIPPQHLVHQQAKMWAYVEWLPTHCVEFHHYIPPKRMTSWVKKGTIEALKKHLAKVASEYKKKK